MVLPLHSLTVLTRRSKGWWWVARDELWHEQCKSNSTARSITQRAELARSMVLIMTSTPVRYPTPNASTGSPQHTSVEVTDPLLCPPELDLCLECPTLVSGSGVLTLRFRTSRSPCRVEFNTRSTTLVTQRLVVATISYSCTHKRNYALSLLTRLSRHRRANDRAVLDGA